MFSAREYHGKLSKSKILSKRKNTMIDLNPEKTSRKEFFKNLRIKRNSYNTIESSEQLSCRSNLKYLSGDSKSILNKSSTVCDTYRRSSNVENNSKKIENLEKTILEQKQTIDELVSEIKQMKLS